MAKTPRSTKAAATTAASKKIAKKAVSTKPAATKPAATKAVSTKPVAKKAAAKKAASTKPVAAKKAASSKPVAAKKAASTKPAAKKSASTKPAATKPAAATKAPAKKAAPVSEQLAFTMDIAPPPSAPTGGALQAGDAAPDFSLESDDGQTYSKASLAGRRFVIYFYPKDDTPGCTKEACDFRDHHAQLLAAGVEVLGVSSDSLKSHGRFRSKYSLGFPLLADPERTLAQAFGAVGMKTMYGKSRMGVIRSTFVVGPAGIIEKTFSPVKVNGHAEAVLQAITSA